MVSHVISKSVFSIKSLHAIFALERSVSVDSHVSQQDEAASKLLVAYSALKRFFSSVVPHVIVENISTIKTFATICTLVLLFYHMSF